MALADILAAMDAEAESELRRIETAAAIKVAEIAADTQLKIAELCNSHSNDGRARLLKERARRINQARLEQIRTVSEAGERLFHKALARARARLAGLRAQADYHSILCALATEALSQIDGTAIIHADASDEAIMRAHFGDRQLVFDLHTWGGVEVRTTDERIIVLNTLEARLEQAAVRLRETLMPLFDREGEACPPMTMAMPGYAR